MKVLVIVGPTGVGKTSLSIKLAKILNGEIISGDSVQVYKDLDIGSAKITKAEMDGVEHHLIDFLEVDEEYSVATFQKEVREKIEEISKKGKLPIICGGTGLYIKAVLTKYEFEENLKRDDFINKYDSLDNEILHNLLKEVDPVSAESFHFNNRVRVIRALEYYEKSGKLISDRKNSDIELYNSVIIGLRMERTKLYARINERVDEMISEGLVKEVEYLVSKRKYINAIGYNELFKYIDKKISLDDAIELIKQNTRRFAKRQFTWFNNQMNTNWIDVDELSKEEIVKNSLNLLKEIDFI
ncbi:tRNA (adenosine(37)-N6)-dimethylallyltransferase MiaA [Mycoplasmatota bacterium zrk1]